MKHRIWRAMRACTTSVWAASEWTQARTVTINRERARVPLTHQRIKNISMEDMPMPFKVDGATTLEAFKVGQNVGFTATEKHNHLVVGPKEQAK